MGSIGADVDELRALARTMDASVTQLRGVVDRLGHRVTTAPWRGPGADRFRQVWAASSKPALGRAAAELASAAEQLRRNADAQERASAAGGGGTAAGGSGPGRLSASAAPNTATAKGVWDDLKSMKDDDGVRIREVVGPDGKTRYVVEIGGTFGAHNGNLGIWQNWPAAMGRDTATSDYIRAEMARRIPPGSEVMMAGYSQGGLYAQIIAAKPGEYKITDVLTYASPPVVGLRVAAGGANVVRFQAPGDIVPHAVPVALATAATAYPLAPWLFPRLAADVALSTAWNQAHSTTPAGVQRGTTEVVGPVEVPKSLNAYQTHVDKQTYDGMAEKWDEGAGGSRSSLERFEPVGGSKLLNS